LISSTSQLGFSYWFEVQVIGFSTEYRQVAYQKIVGSVQNAVSRKSQQQAASVVHEPRPNNTNAAVTVTNDESIDEKFRHAVLDNYESIEHAWNAFDCLSEPKNQLIRSDFKGQLARCSVSNTGDISLVHVAALGMIGLQLKSKEKGTLRKKMDKHNTKVRSESRYLHFPLMSVYSPKLIRFEDFEAFLLGDLESSSSDKKATEQQQSNVAELPVDVPFLPDTYSHRPSVEDQVIDLLLGNVACNGGCIAAHGMGGAGTHRT
jgi:hypothetical protein